MKKFFPILMFLACNLTVWGQTDTVFWFAAPNFFPEPLPQGITGTIGFNITSASTVVSTVTISQPANPSFIPIVVTVNPYQKRYVDFIPYMAQIENQSEDTILNYGIKITSDQPVRAEYKVIKTLTFSELWSASASAIYHLKGNKGLGTEFYTPFCPPGSQSSLEILGNGRLSFEIIATENNTNITITPFVNTLRHSANQPFTITLNKGQTYALSFYTTNPYYDEAGVMYKITSNNLIAVNITFRSISTYGAGSVDQILPTNMIGSEYVCPYFNGGYSDKVILFAIRNNTQVFYGDNGTNRDTTRYLTTLNEGMLVSLTGLANRYIKTTNPVYILHFAHIESLTERVMSIIAPIRCTGTNLAIFSCDTFSRANSIIYIITESAYMNDFELNGSPLSLDFYPVLGTNGQFVMRNMFVWNGSSQFRGNNILKNTRGKFTLGLLNYNHPGGTSYVTSNNYITDYNAQEISTSAANNVLCKGDSLKIAVDSQRYASYKWRYPDGSERTDANLRIGNITTTHSGQYIRTIDNNNCSIKIDTFNVQVHPKYVTPIDTSYCEGSSLVLHGQTYAAEGDYEQHLTSQRTGCDSLLKIRVRKRPLTVLDTSITICQGETYRRANGGQVQQAGYYQDTVRRVGACTYVQNVQLSVRPAPRLFLGNDTTICQGTTRLLSLPEWQGSIQWQDRSTTPTFPVQQTGIYSVQFTHRDGCVSTDSIAVEVVALPEVALGADTVVCAGERVLLNARNQGNQVHWSTGATGQTIPAQQTGIYTVTVTNIFNCATSDSILVTVAAPLNVRIAVPQPILCHKVCQGSLNATCNSIYTPITYHWSNGGTSSQVSNLCAGWYSVVVEDSLGCVAQQAQLLEQPSPLQAQTFVRSNHNGYGVSCLGNRDGRAEVMATGGTGAYAVLWETTPPQTSVEASHLTAGMHSVMVTDANHCQDIAQVTLTAPDSIQVVMAALKPICEGNADGKMVFQNIVGGIAPFTLWLDTVQKIPNITNGYTVTGLKAQTYQLKISDINNCFSRIFEKSVQAMPSLALMVANDTVVALGDSISIWVRTLNRPIEVIDYQWMPNKYLSCDTCATTIAQPLFPMDYHVRAKDEYGCASEKNIRVGTVTENPIFVPNVFSPNGDNVNDKLTIHAKNSVKRIVKFEIFNRWGSRVLSDSDFLPDNDAHSWNGILNDKMMSTEIFIWYATVELIDGSLQTLTGDTTIVK